MIKTNNGDIFETLEEAKAYAMPCEISKEDYIGDNFEKDLAYHNELKSEIENAETFEELVTAYNNYANYFGTFNYFEIKEV